MTENLEFPIDHDPEGRRLDPSEGQRPIPPCFWEMDVGGTTSIHADDPIGFGSADGC